jgi:hypothetical protein
MNMAKTQWAGVIAAAVLMSGFSAQAQTPVYTPGYDAAPPVPEYQQAAAPTALAPQQLDQLLGPIALYPDPLLSEVLAAATYPDDIAAAAQWLQSFPTPSEQDIDAQPWDPSVEAIVHYPTVLQMLASQPDWTAALGAAFASQQQDVMASIQRLRAEALAAHTLVSSDQQQVVTDNGEIEVLPTQPNTIYVPSYDPGTIYVGNPGYDQPWITFSPGYPVGAWLDLGWDWRGRRIDNGVRWGGDWRHPTFSNPRPWVHDPGRPLPRPRFPAGAPHGVEPGRGFGGAVRPGTAFDPRLAPRPGERPVTPVRERPVVGIEPHAVPVAPHPEVRAPGPVPVFHPEPRSAPVVERGPVERPVIGIPHPAPGPIERAPVEHAPPVEHAAPPPVERSAPAPSAFHGGGGGAGVQSARGHGSMGR